MVDRKLFKIFFLFAAFLFLFIIKCFNYDRYPLMGHLEEYAYSWMGIHLLTSGIPQTWSPGEKPHPSQDIAFSGKISNYGVDLYVDILAPWLDLPPLYGILSGGAAYLLGADKWSVLPASYIRLPAIIFSFLTTLVLFFLVKKLFGFNLAFLAVTFYSLTPLFVFSQRLSVAENGITFLYLTSIWLTVVYIEKRKGYLLGLLPILIGLAGLMKQTGFLIMFLIIFLLAEKKLWKEALFVFFGVLWFLGFLLIYGWSVNLGIFKDVTLNQSKRPVGFLGLPFLFSTAGYSIDFFYDGWYVFSLIATIYYSLTKFRERNYQIVSLGFIFWAMVVVFSGGQADVLLWYRYPFFPFLAVFGSLMLAEIAKKPNLFTSILVVGMLLTGRVFLSNEFRPLTQPFKFRMIVAVLLLPIICFHLFNKPIFEKLAKLVVVGVIIAGLFLNAQAIYSAFPIASASKSFPMGPTTFLSEIHLPVIWRLFLRE